ncbi:MAG: zinc ribbon domain-containing protein [Vicinamibacterales bacterium]
MSEDSAVFAREKFSCPACGGESQWNPGKQALVCPYCGTESPATLQALSSGSAIVEHDLATALRAVPDTARGWQAVKTTVQCQSCHAISVFDPEHISQRCNFCGSTALVPYDQVKDAFRPESLLPLKISESQSRDLIRGWFAKQWLAPNALKRKALTDTVKGIYLPFWTFDANAYARWTAESGTYYYVREGNKNVRRVRWSPASGELSHVFNDELVSASLGVDRERLRKVEPFPTDALVPYDAGYLSGWTVERYQIDLVGAATRSREQMEATLRELCGRQVPGDTHRNLQVAATFSNQTFKHILAPVWLLTYLYGRTTYQVIVNGVTGRMSGAHPWSWVKITLLVLLALIVIITIAVLDNS